MSKYTINLETTNWYCECCGSGTHFSIVLFEGGQRVWSTSRDDRFGGVLDEEVDEDMDISTWENFIKGMKKALELAGHEVTLETEIDATDPYDQHDWLDDVDDDEMEEDYRDDLL
jgi:hypothetical protein